MRRSLLLCAPCALAIVTSACSAPEDTLEPMGATLDDLRKHPPRHGGLDAGTADAARADADARDAQANNDAAGSATLDASTTSEAGPATAGPDIPANTVALADYGGVPGASPSTIRSAFASAFAQLKSLGGGTLMIGPGVYDLGDQSVSGYVTQVDGLHDVFISGYGAKLTMRTTAQVMPVFLHFSNPENVTVAGLGFYDYGTDLSVDWRGAICLDVDASAPHSRFHVVDVLAENVVTFFRSWSDYNMTGFDLQGTVKNSYYGVNPNYSGRYSKANIKTENVRRAFIGYGAQNWDIKIDAIGGGRGSNGFVCLIPDASQPVHDVNVDVTMSGTSVYGGTVHFYHQGPSSSSQYLRNVKANVVYNNVTSQYPMFLFDHAAESGVAATTIRTWERVELTGTINGAYGGRIVSNPSVSTGTTNSISVAANLAAYQDMSALPSYFHVQ